MKHNLPIEKLTNLSYDFNSITSSFTHYIDDVVYSIRAFECNKVGCYHTKKEKEFIFLGEKKQLEICNKIIENLNLLMPLLNKFYFDITNINTVENIYKNSIDILIELIEIIENQKYDNILKKRNTKVDVMRIEKMIDQIDLMEDENNE